MIDKEKWGININCEKYAFIKATFNMADMDCVSKDDLIMMCKFMLDMTSNLTEHNAELQSKLNELKKRQIVEEVTYGT